MNTIRPLAALAAAALVAATLTGCSVIESIFVDGPTATPQEGHFEVHADVPTDGGDGHFAMPLFVPKDAVDIDVKMKVNTEAGYLLRYNSPAGFRDDRCDAVDAAPPSAIDAEWWPDEFTGAMFLCTEKRFDRDIYVTVVGDTVYGWTADDAAPADGDTGTDPGTDPAADPSAEG